MVTKRDLYNKLMRQSSGYRYNKFMQQIYGSLYISITSKCNLQCRHCSNMEDYDLPDANPAEVKNWLSQMAQTEYKFVMFVGGEPLLLEDQLADYIGHAAGLDMISTIITNGSWAVTQDKAKEILMRFPNLGSVIVSSDLYHLEFVDKEIIYNLALACLDLNINITVNITCATKEEGEAVKALYADFSGHNKFHIALSPMFAWGAAKDLEIERFTYFKNPDMLSDVCEIRNHFINNVGEVYACCGATLSEDTECLKLGDLRKESFKEILRRRDSDPIFNFIDKSGPKGLAEVIVNSPFYDRVKEKAYTNKCDLCISVLNDDAMYQYLINKFTEKE